MERVLECKKRRQILATGPAAMPREVTPNNLDWLCRDCHRSKTRQDRRLAGFFWCGRNLSKAEAMNRNPSANINLLEY